jgi:hypothetical protein
VLAEAAEADTPRRPSFRRHPAHFRSGGSG